MGHKIPERPDDGRDEEGKFKKRDFFERRGMAKHLGKTMTQGDYQALEALRDVVRGSWLVFADVLMGKDQDYKDWREVIQSKIELAKEKTAQGNKAAELLFRYALGDKAPTGTERKTRLEILVKQILESPLVLSADEVEIVAAVEERHGLLAPPGTDAGAPASSEIETGSGRGAGREKQT